MKSQEIQKRALHGRKLVTTTMDGDMVDQLNSLSEECGMSRSALMRSAVSGFLEDGANSGPRVLNLTLLAQKLTEVREKLPEDDFKDMEKLIGNLTKLEGGNQHGGF